MKTTLFLSLLFSAQLCLADCGVYVKNQAKLSKLIGSEELRSALESRGYYLRTKDFEDVELELDVVFNDIQVCYRSDLTVGQEIEILWNELVNPPSSVEVKASYVKEGFEETYAKGLALYNGNGAKVRRAVRSLIRKIPKCD